MNKTSIEWCDFTWNPIRARLKTTGTHANGKQPHTGTFCTRISPGCTHCYASVINKRFGNGLEYTVPNLDKVEFFIDQKILEQPLNRKRPARIFVGDMFDLFHEAIPDDLILDVWDIMNICRQHTFQVAPAGGARQNFVSRLHCALGNEEWYFMLKDSPLPGDGYRLPHVWLGVSVEDQPRADERIPLLLDTPAAVHFLSVQPQLENILLPRQVFLPHGVCGDWPFGHTTRRGGGNALAFSNPQGALSVIADDGKLLGIKPGEFQEKDKGLGIDWVICGGESGPGARPFNLAWAESLLAQCRGAGVAFFMKDIGSNPRIYSGHDQLEMGWPPASDRKGGTMADWPPSLRVREFPQTAVAA